MVYAISRCAATVAFSRCANGQWAMTAILTQLKENDPVDPDLFHLFLTTDVGALQAARFFRPVPFSVRQASQL